MELVNIHSISKNKNFHQGDRIHGCGVCVRHYKSLKPSKAMCAGCRDDYYNHANRESGGCWCFSSAKVVDKVGYSSIYVEGGPDVLKKKTLSCWNSVQK